MSLGDQLRYLRAMKDGIPLNDMRAALGDETVKMLRQIEQRYRDVSDEVFVEKMAACYGVPVEELQWHRVRSRKALALHIHAAMRAHQTVTLRLRHGETLSGQPIWWDLGAIGLQPIEGGSLIVVQRHAVIDWDGVERTED